MSLFQSVCNRQYSGGLKCFREIRKKRLKSLELSRQIDVEKPSSGSIFCMDIEPEQRYLLGGSSDGSISIFDLEPQTSSPKKKCPIVASVRRGASASSKHAHKYMIVSCEWHPHDCGMFSTSSTDKCLKIWDTNRLKPIDSHNFDKELSQHVWCANKPSLLAVAAGQNAVNLVDLKSGSRFQQLRGHKKMANVLRWSKLNSNVLFSGGFDGQILVWDIRSSKSALASLRPAAGSKRKKLNSENFTSRAHSAEVNGLRLSEDGLLLFSLGTEGALRVWDTRKLKEKTIPSLEFLCESSVPRKLIHFDLCLNGTESCLFLPAGDNIEMIEPFGSIGEGPKVLRGHYNAVNSCVYRSDYQQLYTAANDKAVLCWVPKMDQNVLFSEHKVGDLKEIQKLRQDDWSDDDM